jgi:hypothetical protein
METKISRTHRRAKNKDKCSSEQIAQRLAARELARQQRSPGEQNLKSLRQHLKKPNNIYEKLLEKTTAMISFKRRNGLLLTSNPG